MVPDMAGSRRASIGLWASRIIRFLKVERVACHLIQVYLPAIWIKPRPELYLLKRISVLNMEHTTPVTYISYSQVLSARLQSNEIVMYAAYCVVPAQDISIH